MNRTIDTCDTMRNNLIAAALGLQQCTQTAANIVPLPGTERFITIGTPAEVVGLLRKQVLPSVDQAAEDKSETDIVQDVAEFFRAFGFEVRDELGAQSVFSVLGSLDSAAQLLEFCLGPGGQQRRPLGQHEAADLGGGTLPGSIRPGVGEAAPFKERRRVPGAGME